MRTNRSRGIASLLFAAALVAGCGSGGLGDILGGGTGSTGGTSTAGDLSGTVERVDTRDRVVWVDSEDAYRYGLRNEGDLVALHYDDQTRVVFEGQAYRADDLEAGDRIVAEVARSGDRLFAEEIEVLYDVSRGSTSSPGSQSGYAADVRGVVREVDTYDRTLTLEQARYGQGFTTGTGSSTGSGTVVEILYDAETVVEFDGRRYAPENLERGDLVEVEVRDLGSRLLAEEIEVISDVRDRASSL